MQLVEVTPNSIIVNSSRVTKKSATDLVELAMEIQKADSFVHANACNKLQVIAQQASIQENVVSLAISTVDAIFTETSTQRAVRSTKKR